MATDQHDVRLTAVPLDALIYAIESDDITEGPDRRTTLALAVLRSFQDEAWADEDIRVIQYAY